MTRKIIFPDDKKRKLFEALYGGGENPAATLSRLLTEEEFLDIDAESFDKLEKRLAAAMNDLPPGFSRQTQGRDHYRKNTRAGKNPPFQDTEFLARVPDDIKLHEDVWEYLELTGHPIVFGWFGRPSYSQHREARLVVISYVEPFHPIEIINSLKNDGMVMKEENVTELEMRYGVKELFSNRCPAAILIHSPDSAIELIENTVNKKRINDYDPPKRIDEDW